MANEISEWTAGAVGKTYADRVVFSFPLCHVHATRETLTVRIVWRKHTLSKDQVSAIRRYNERALLSDCKEIQIMHTDPNCPPFLVFYFIGKREATLERFKQLGYNVTEDIGGPSKETP